MCALECLRKWSTPALVDCAPGQGCMTFESVLIRICIWKGRIRKFSHLTDHSPIELNIVIHLHIDVGRPVALDVATEEGWGWGAGGS